MTSIRTQKAKHYSLMHSPNPYKVYQLANSSISVNVLTDGRIQFIVSIGVGDPVNWRVYINAKKDHGQGNYGGDYPYAVETVTGSQNSTFYRTSNTGLYWSDDYSAVLALLGVGEVDFATFTISGGTQPPTTQPPTTQPPTTQPPGKYIIHWRIYNGRGGKVNVYRNGSPFGTVTGSAIQTFTFNVGDVLRYEAVPDSGWRYDGTCNSGDNTCDSTNPYQGTIAVPMEFSAASVFTPTTAQTHNICQNNICTQVSGPGTNECNNIGFSCGGVPFHNVCQNNICTRVAGTGTDECANVGVSCSGTTSPPPGGPECPNCDLTTNYCLLGSCIPKQYAILGGIGLFAFMMFKR